MCRSNRPWLYSLALVATAFGGCGGKGASESSSVQGSRGGEPAAAGTTNTKGGQSSTSTFIDVTGGTFVAVGGAAALGGTSSQEPLDAGAPLGGASGASGTGGAPGIGGVAGSSPASFPDYLLGLWIIGWSGGLDHYSWIRFSPYDPNLGGRIDLLDPPDSGAWDPFLACAGTGRWYLTARPQTIELWLPAACGQDAKFTFTVESIGSASSYGMFSKASQQATLKAIGSTSTGGNPINAFKYPEAQCDVAMTSCRAPE